jgi:hypothetical protein
VGARREVVSPQPTGGVLGLCGETRCGGDAKIGGAPNTSWGAEGLRWEIPRIFGFGDWPGHLAAYTVLGPTRWGEVNAGQNRDGRRAG